ncbi:PrgI family protein [Lactococcus lactis]|uniref:PrgI family protein n=1 Tax=Lactococcus lactis TaxID=1358 RepID=A0AAW5TRL6_9LACT|nr:PrgI family protein [Lactococcus lactis]MCW2280158.1 hypothetical protein [Lactococcus lactis]
MIIKVHQDVTKQAGKYMWGLTIRQLGGTAGIVVTLGLLGTGYFVLHLPSLVLFIGAGLLLFPCLVFGFFKVSGIPFERFYKLFKRYHKLKGIHAFRTERLRRFTRNEFK